MRRKGLKRKLSNIVLLAVLLATVLGIYYNVYNSRAEDVLEITAVAMDNYGYLNDEEFKLEAKPTENDMYEIELPESINSKKVNQIYNAILEEIVDVNQEEKGKIEKNETEVPKVETIIDENEAVTEESEMPSEQNEGIADQAETTIQENEVATEELDNTTKVEGTTKEQTTEEKQNENEDEQVTSENEKEQVETENEILAEQEQNVENTTEKIEIAENKIILSRVKL